MRPVVILEDEIAAVVAPKIAAAKPQPRFTYCELEDWEAKGLVKLSRIQTKPLFRIVPNNLFNDGALNVLSPGDGMRLDQALQS